MIVEIKETDYKGFHLEHIENKGWQIVLHDVRILFPTFQDAQCAVDAFYREAVPKFRGKKVKTEG